MIVFTQHEQLEPFDGDGGTKDTNILDFISTWSSSTNSTSNKRSFQWKFSYMVSKIQQNDIEQNHIYYLLLNDMNVIKLPSDYSFVGQFIRHSSFKWNSAENKMNKKVRRKKSMSEVLNGFIFINGSRADVLFECRSKEHLKNILYFGPIKSIKWPSLHFECLKNAF